MEVLVHNAGEGYTTFSLKQSAVKQINKKWGDKGVKAFEKSMNKGFVGEKGANGIKTLKGNPYKGKYKFEIKVKNKEYANYRVYGYEDNGKIVFDLFGKALH